MLLEPIETEKLFPISLFFDSKGLVILILIIMIIIIMITLMIMIMYCLKNEQECIIRFKKLEAPPRAFKRDNTRLRVFLMASKSPI